MLIDLLYGKIIFAAFLLVCAVMDVRCMEVHVAVFAAMFLLILCGYIWMAAEGFGRMPSAEFTIDWLSMGKGLAAAAAVWLVSILTHQQIGYGDAVFFTLTAMVLGSRNNLLLMGGLLACSLVGIIILLCEKLKGNSIRDRRLPFLPIVFPVGIAVMFT